MMTNLFADQGVERGARERRRGRDDHPHIARLQAPGQLRHGELVAHRLPTRMECICERGQCGKTATKEKFTEDSTHLAGLWVKAERPQHAGRALLRVSVRRLQKLGQQLEAINLQEELAVAADIAQESSGSGQRLPGTRVILEHHHDEKKKEKETPTPRAE